MAFIRTSNSGDSGLPTLNILAQVNAPGTTKYTFTNDYPHILADYVQASSAYQSVTFPEGSTVKQTLISTDNNRRLYELENVKNGTSITWTSLGWGNAMIYTF